MIAPWLYPLLFLTGLAAGFVDSIAGGGGLITLPVLLNIGLSSPEALATNKLQAVFGSGSAARRYAQAGLVDWHQCVWGILFTAIGAGIGTHYVQQLDPHLLQRIIPWLLLLLTFYLVCRPQLGDREGPARMSPRWFDFVFGLGLGFYDGFLGPGTGSFWAMAFVLVMGFNLTRATAQTKVMNFTSNVVSLAIFLWGGHGHWGAGISMGLGQWLGARLGAGTVLRRGANFIRPIFVVVTLAVTARLLWKNLSSP